MSNRLYTDHKGNEFPSFSAMCRHYNLPTSTVNNRLLRNWTLEQALTVDNSHNNACKVIPKNNKYVYDHLGNRYNTISEMAEHYGITDKIYWGRKRQCKWPLEKILTTPVALPNQTANAITICDHLGNEFISISEMCKYWNMTRSTYNARRKNGWSIEKALTTPKKKIKVEKQEWVDHKGNHYPSLNAMCKQYGITHHTFKTRVDKLGWSIEKALTTKKIINSIEISDMYGHTFPSLKDMAHYYHIPEYFLQGKKLYDTNNQLKQHTLTALLEKGLKNYPQITDNLVLQKCIGWPYYQVSYNNTTLIMTINQILDIYHNNNFYPLPDRKIMLKNFSIKKVLSFPNYEIEKDEETLIWSYWDIINYCHDNNFGI